MALTEAEELELLELEEQEAAGSQQQPQAPSAWQATQQALGSRPELQPYSYPPDPIPADPVGGALNMARRTLEAPIRLGQTLSSGPQVLGETITEESALAGYPKTGLAIGGAVAMAPYIAGAYSALKGLARPPLQSTDAQYQISKQARKSASSGWFKAVGGTPANARELGADEALRLGRMARKTGVITPFNSVENQAENIAKGLDSSGRKIGELRAMGDLYGDSPEAMKIVQTIKQDLGARYGSGIRSGESGDLDKAIQEVLKLEPVDTLTAGEELSGFMQKGIPPETSSFRVTTPGKGVPTIPQNNPIYPMAGGKTVNAPNPAYTPPSESNVQINRGPYDQFRLAQESPDYIPEYDIRRPTTFNEVAKVATDINQYAKGQSKLLQPTGAMTDAANVISRVNDESLMKALPEQKGIEYKQNLQKFGDLSKLDRMNELKAAGEVGANQNGVIKSIYNMVFHRFRHQLSAQAMDTIANVLSTKSRLAPQMNPVSAAVAGRKALISQFIDNRSKGSNQ